jgi:uncharacterized membrane protein
MFYTFDMTITSKSRFEQFSDGVFAIAITLLALQLHVPTLISPTLSGALRELIPFIPNILTFFICFFSVAIFWVNHHQLTQEIKLIKRRTLWMNVLFLFFVTLIPFVVQAASENSGHPLAVLTFALVLLGGSASFSVLRYLVHENLGEHRIPIARSLIGPIFYFLAAAACLIDVWIAYLLLVIPPLYYFLPKEHRSYKHQNDSTVPLPSEERSVIHSTHINHFNSVSMTLIRRILIIFVLVYFLASFYHLVAGDTMQVIEFGTLHLTNFRIAFAAIALIISVCLIWRPLRMMGTLLGSAYLGGALLISFTLGENPAIAALALISLWVVLKLSWWKHWCLCGHCDRCRARLESEVTVKEKTSGMKKDMCGCKPGCMCERGKCTC